MYAHSYLLYCSTSPSCAIGVVSDSFIFCMFCFFCALRKLQVGFYPCRYYFVSLIDWLNSHQTPTTRKGKPTRSIRTEQKKPRNKEEAEYTENVYNTRLPIIWLLVVCWTEKGRATVVVLEEKCRSPLTVSIPSYGQPRSHLPVTFGGTCAYDLDRTGQCSEIMYKWAYAKPGRKAKCVRMT